MVEILGSSWSPLCVSDPISMIRRGAQMDATFTFTLPVRVNICAFSDFSVCISLHPTAKMIYMSEVPRVSVKGSLHAFSGGVNLLTVWWMTHLHHSYAQTVRPLKRH